MEVSTQTIPFTTPDGVSLGTEFGYFPNIQFSTIGTYTFKVNVTDAAGNNSNTLTTTLSTTANIDQAVGSSVPRESGSYLSPWGSGAPSHQPAVAVKITPLSYPATISTVTLYVSNNTGTGQMFNLHGYSDLTTGTDIFAPLLNQTVPVTGAGCIPRILELPPTTIASGSFYLAVEWVNKPLNSAAGGNSFFFYTDSHLDHPNTNYIRYGSSWIPLESLNPPTGDIGIAVNMITN